MTKGRIRAPLHYVDERDMGKARISMPFFTRCRPSAKLVGEDLTVADFMEQVVTTARPWVAPPHSAARAGVRANVCGCMYVNVCASVCVCVSSVCYVCVWLGGGASHGA